MIRHDSRLSPPPELRGAILALGNFDGFHAGHQAVVTEALAWARAEGRPGIVASFDPHPVRVFVPDAAPFHLTSLDQRAELFAAAGADAMLVFGFDAAMAATSAADWVRAVLRQHLGLAGVVTGGDFTFGARRQGDVGLLASLGAEVSLRTRVAAPVIDAGAVVSSTRIRAALKAGGLATANRLLTRPFAVRGVVEHGDQVGRGLGYPTANLGMGDYVRPAYGVYAVTGRLPDGRVLAGVANLGVRPMFTPPHELLEPYFFDFDGDLYGAEIEVALQHYLRGEARFATIAELKAQIGRDCAMARKLLGASA